MLTLFAAVFLSVQDPGPDAFVEAWSLCAARHSLAALQGPNPPASEVIVDAALAACQAEEERMRQDLIRDLGRRNGAEAFVRIRSGARSNMILRVNQARAMRGV